MADRQFPVLSLLLLLLLVRQLCLLAALRCRALLPQLPPPLPLPLPVPPLRVLIRWMRPSCPFRYGATVMLH
jgi:hypothetical protein